MPAYKVIGVIPARYGSTRFPGKMLANILGKSLLRRTYENSLRCSSLDKVVVATDDKQIFDHVKEFGGNVVMSSPEALAGTDRVAEVVKRDFNDVDIVVVIQGDEPCLDPSVITTLVNDLKANEKADMTTPVEPITLQEEIFRSSIVKCIFDNSKKALYFSRAPIPFVHRENVGEKHTFYRHMGVYCFRKNFLLKYPELPSSRLQGMEDLEQLKILENGFSIYVSIVSPQGSIGVDYPEDIKKVEAIICRENTSSSQVVSSLL